MKPSPTIVCCAKAYDTAWRWVARDLGDQTPQWKFFFVPLEPKPRFLPVGFNKYAIYRRCTDLIATGQPAMLFTHDPGVSAWCATLCRRRRLAIEHCAFAFNFARLPRGPRYHFMKRAFAAIDTFVVFSNLERRLYSKYFDIPESKLQFLHWAVEDPEVASPSSGIVAGDYLCAVGGNGRDYATLLAAMAALPDIRAVLVCRPDNLRGLTIPPNVTVHRQLPAPETMNIVKFSRFMVLPLRGSDVPCGHVTLVNAMKLEKSMIITDSSGVADYITHGSNALTCRPGDADELGNRIRWLWDREDERRRMAANGKNFADRFCARPTTVEYVRTFLQQRNLLPSPDSAASGPVE